MAPKRLLLAGLDAGLLPVRRLARSAEVPLL